MNFHLFPRSGRGGRVTKKDILAYVDKREEVVEEEKMRSEPEVPEPLPLEEPEVATENSVMVDHTPARQVSYANNENYEIVEMDRMRKLIAKKYDFTPNRRPHMSLLLWKQM